MLRARIMPLYRTIANSAPTPRTAKVTIRIAPVLTSRHRLGRRAGIGQPARDRCRLRHEVVELGCVVAVVRDRDDESVVLDLDQHPGVRLVEAPDDEGRLEQESQRQVGGTVRDLELVLAVELRGLELDDAVR